MLVLVCEAAEVANVINNGKLGQIRQHYPHGNGKDKASELRIHGQIFLKIFILKELTFLKYNKFM